MLPRPQELRDSFSNVVNSLFFFTEENRNLVLNNSSPTKPNFSYAIETENVTPPLQHLNIYFGIFNVLIQDVVHFLLGTCSKIRKTVIKTSHDHKERTINTWSLPFMRMEIYSI